LPTTVKEAIRRHEEDGWALVATKGSHRQFKHETKKGRVTVPGKLSSDLQPGTLKSILRQAGLKD
jgi:predicted RNA binding protein YcfA (HicA-like mRNA interferase family)